MADKYLLENGVDRYLKEDDSGVLLLDGPVTFAGVADIAFGTVLSKFNRSIKYIIN